MSEELVFSDMLNHYSLKCAEISDMCSTMVSYLDKSVFIANDSWSSAAAEIFSDNIIMLKDQTKDLTSSLDEVMKLLNSAKGNLLDSDLSEF